MSGVVPEEYRCAYFTVQGVWQARINILAASQK